MPERFVGNISEQICSSCERDVRRIGGPYIYLIETLPDTSEIGHFFCSHICLKRWVEDVLDDLDREDANA